MTEVKSKHVDRFFDRHGKLRYYFRRGHGPRVVLEGKPGSPRFLAWYQRASNGEPAEKPERKRREPGTFDRVVQENEIERYTKAAEQKKLATAAIRRLKKRTANKNSQTSR
jgi:hypothetical protein